MENFKTFQTFIDPDLKLPPKGRGYFRYASRQSCLAREEWFLSWMVFRGARSAIIVPNGCLHEYYLENSAMKAHSSWAKHVYKTWPQQLTQYPIRSKALIKSAKALAKSIKTRNNRVVFKYYKGYIQQAKDYSDYIMGAWSIIYFIEPRVLSAFPKNQDTIIALEKPIAFIKMKRDLFRLPIAQVIKKYGWLNVYSPHDRRYTASDLKKIKAQTRKNEIELQYKSFRQNKKAYAFFRKQIKDAGLRKLADIVHAYAFIKTDRMDVWKESMDILKPFFLYLAKSIPGGTISRAVFLSSEEICRLLDTGAPPPLDSLKLREKLGVTYYYSHGRLTLVPGLKAAKNTLCQLDNKNNPTGSIKGTCANKGKAKGKVKIILSSHDLAKIKKGDIFVAPYTFPTFTHAMLKCRAIVTDEGGITSHAAIIAREYRIPCIIGAKTAIKDLKDGDLIEVDADKGLVKIIKK